MKCKMLYKPSRGLHRDIGTCKRKYENKDCNGSLVQVPFVMFCQSGHIEDFHGIVVQKS